jgi:hypothetical protein
MEYGREIQIKIHLLHGGISKDEKYEKGVIVLFYLKSQAQEISVP